MYLMLRKRNPRAFGFGNEKFCMQVTNLSCVNMLPSASMVFHRRQKVKKKETPVSRSLQSRFQQRWALKRGLKKDKEGEVAPCWSSGRQFRT